MHEITVILYKYSPDILEITESRLDQSIPDGQIVLYGYNFLRSDSSTSIGGGLVINFKLELSFTGWFLNCLIVRPYTTVLLFPGVNHSR